MSIWRNQLILLLFVFTTHGAATAADNSTLATLWPLFDYRSSEAAHYSSLHLMGPLFKYEVKGDETEYALRPFFYSSGDKDGRSRTEILYPLAGLKKDRDSTSFHLLHLLNYDFGARESGSRNRSYLFPFLFYGQEDQGTYAAFFPFWGTLYNWFGKDRIDFRFFPLYSHTQSGSTKVDNFFWPFIAKISGENETGFKIWPFYGESRKKGVYKKSFFLWPVFSKSIVGLDGDNPEETKAVWPLFVSRESKEKSYRAILWPFINWSRNHEKNYEVLNLPWPFVRITKGDRHYGLKIFPFYADETMDVVRQRWYLWPLYKIEEWDSELLLRRRDRVLFFLYSDTREIRWETGKSVRRIQLWPLFGYRYENGVSHLYALSLMGPFFSEYKAIERSWAPLWRIYQQKWDRQGNQVISVLWNLFWSEKQGDMRAWELFPLFKYHRTGPDDLSFDLLKGLFSYRSGNDGKEINLLYLPWGIRIGS